MPARILIVCSANVCRSPVMAGLLSARLAGVEIDSRGVRATDGREMCVTSATWLRAQGLPRPEHASRLLTVADIRASTLILTATRWLRASVLELRPAASVRTHTLAEAARTIDWRVGQGAAAPTSADLGERVLWLAEELHEYRAAAPRPPTPDADDLADPHNGAKHSTVLKALLHTADRLSEALR